MFSQEEYQRISLGLLPERMEDYWFIYLEGEWLYFHRSYSGLCLYQVRLAQVADSYVISEAWVNQHPQQRPSWDDEFNVALPAFLIDRLLLEKDVPIPDPPRPIAEEPRRKWWQIWK